MFPQNSVSFSDVTFTEEGKLLFLNVWQHSFPLRDEACYRVSLRAGGGEGIKDFVLYRKSLEKELQIEN